MAKRYKWRKGGRPLKQLRSIRKTFHIICEGQNTEPDYFKGFPQANIKVQTFGLGQQRKKLVESTIDYIRKKGIRIDETEEVWVVFDFDIKEEQIGQIRQNYNEAIQLAHSNNIKCAISNDCFELWYYLHFQFTDAAHRREFYSKSLSKNLKTSYGKAQKVSTEMYNQLLKNQQTAINNAEKLEKIHKGKLAHEKNPYTSVYKLVKALIDSEKNK